MPEDDRTVFTFKIFFAEQKWWSEQMKTENGAKKAAAPAAETKEPAAPAGQPSAGAASRGGGKDTAARGRGAPGRGRGVESSSSNIQTKGDKSKHICVPQARRDKLAEIFIFLLRLKFLTSAVINYQLLQHFPLACSNMSFFFLFNIFCFVVI